MRCALASVATLVLPLAIKSFFRNTKASPAPPACDHDYHMLAEGYQPPLDMPPARLPNGVKLERIYWREDVCRKCGHAVRVA